MDKRGGQGRTAKHAIGATLQSCTHNHDSDQTAAILGARWVLLVGRNNTDH